MTIEQTPPPAGTAPAADETQKDCCATLQAELDTANAELAKLREDMLRERADLENQRRRVARDIDVARKFANDRVLGVIGPTRMDYDRVIPVVQAAADILGDALQTDRSG